MPSKYLKTTKKGFETLLKKANELLGLPDGNGNDSYCSPLINTKGDFFFIVNQEVLSLVDESKLVDYDSIDIPQPKI
jgi:hypothetical protein